MVSERLKPFGESVFSTMTRLANEHGAINLSQGFPDFDGPDWLKEAAARAIAQGPNQYAPSAGHPGLRAALARKARRDYDLSYNPDSEITVTCGATEALAATLLGLLEPGDEAVIFEPYYDSYPALTALAGATTHFLPLRAPDFALDLEGLERLLNARTKLVLFNSPTNPSGRVYSRSELEALAAVLRKHPHVVLVTDEVYEHLVYPPYVHIPMATLEGMRDRTVLISSTSKTLSMTGWKVGYVYAPAPLSLAVRSAHQFLTFCAVSPLQAAMAEAIDKLPEYLPGLASEYLQRRDRWVETLRRLGFTLEAPQGTYFAVTDVGEDDMTFCQRMTREACVAAIPCSAFYTHKEVGKTLVRWAFCKGLDTLDEAARRLESWQR